MPRTVCMYENSADQRLGLCRPTAGANSPPAFRTDEGKAAICFQCWGPSNPIFLIPEQSDLLKVAGQIRPRVAVVAENSYTGHHRWSWNFSASSLHSSRSPTHPVSVTQGKTKPNRDKTGTQNRKTRLRRRLEEEMYT